MQNSTFLKIGEKEQACESLLSSDHQSESDSDRIQAIDKAYLEWSNVNFYVPYVEDDSITSLIKAEDASKGLPPISIKMLKGLRQPMKKVLHDSSGYVCPNEMVAILGPSGSGKTSLLNIIS